MEKVWKFSGVNWFFKKKKIEDKFIGILIFTPPSIETILYGCKHLGGNTHLS